MVQTAAVQIKHPPEGYLAVLHEKDLDAAAGTRIQVNNERRTPVWRRLDAVSRLVFKEIPKHEEDGVKQTRWKKDSSQCQNRSIPLPSLKEVRRSRGLTQRDLGRLAKVAPGTVYRLENGLRGGYPVTVRKLAEALRVSPAELVCERRRE